MFNISVSASRPERTKKIYDSLFAKAKIYANLAVVPLLLLAVWQILASMGVLLEVVLPSPWKVWLAFEGIIADGTLFIDLRDSGTRVMTGFFWGSLLGLVLGVVSGLSKIVERLISPLVDIMRQIPIYA